MKQGMRHYAHHVNYNGCFCRQCKAQKESKFSRQWRASVFRVAKKKERREAFRVEREAG